MRVLALSVLYLLYWLSFFFQVMEVLPYFPIHTYTLFSDLCYDDGLFAVDVEASSSKLTVLPRFKPLPSVDHAWMLHAPRCDMHFSR